MPLAAAQPYDSSHNFVFGSSVAGTAPTNDTLVLPVRAVPLQYRSFWQGVLDWSKGQLLAENIQSTFGSKTQTAATVQSISLSQAANGAVLGFKQADTTYLDPSFVSVGGVYEYTTSFGIYSLTPLNALGTYLVTYRTSDMARGDRIAGTGFLLLENHSGPWLPFSGSVVTANPVTVTNTRFTASWELNYPTGKGKQTQDVGQVQFTVDFGRTTLPKISVQLVKTFYQVDPKCIDTFPSPNPCATTYYWNDLSLKDVQWVWDLIPQSGYDTFQSAKYGGIGVSSFSGSLDKVSDAASDHASFTSSVDSKKNWVADWRGKGSKSLQFTAGNLLTSSRAVTVAFDINDLSIDPTFGLSSTGSTSYPTTTLGYSSIAANGEGGGGGYVGCLNKITISTPFLIEAFSVYYSTGGQSGGVKLGVYNDSGGSVANQALVAQTGGYTQPSGAGWYTWTLSSSDYIYVDPGGTSKSYWTCYLLQNNLAGAYARGQNALTNYYWAQAYAGGFPANAPASPTSETTGNRSFYGSGFMTKGYAKLTKATLTDAATVTSISAYFHAAGNWRSAIFSKQWTSPTTTDSTATGTDYYAPYCSNILAFQITASATGILQTVGIDWQGTEAGYSVEVALYANTGSGTNLTSRLSDSGVVSANSVAGYQDIAVSPAYKVTVGTTYDLAWVVTKAGCSGAGKSIYENSTLFGYSAVWYSHSSLDNPWGGGSTSYTEFVYNLRMTYNSTELPNSKLVDCPSTAASAAAWATVNISSCTPTSLSLTPDDYWLGLQWDSASNGPSYTAGAAGSGSWIAQAYGAFPATWTGGASTAEDWSIYATYTQRPSQPITISSVVGGATFSISGCNPNPATIVNDGVSHSVFVDPSCSLTVTVPSDGANTRYRFSPLSTTWTFSTCAAPGPCGAQTHTAYYQLQNTYQATPLAQTTWDAGLAALNVTGTLLGSSSQTVCSITLTGGGGAASSSCWADYNTAASLAVTISGAPSSTQWIALGTRIFTDTTGGNTRNVNYYKQFQVSFATSGIGSDTGSNPVVKVAGVNKTQSLLPYTAWYNASFSLSYQFYSPVVGTGSSYPWSSTTGLGQTLQSNTFTVIQTGTVTGSYGVNYLLIITLNAHGVSTPTSGGTYAPGTIVTVTISGDGSSNSSTVRYLYSSVVGSGSGGYSGSSRSFNVTMNSGITETIAWTTQYSVTITSTGIGGDTSGSVVVTVGSVPKTQGDLPFTTWYNSGASITYSFASTVSASAGKYYSWSSTTGLSQTLQGNTFTVSAAGTVTGTFVTASQYQLQIRAVDKYNTARALNTTRASVNVTTSYGSQQVLTANSTGWMNFGNYYSGVQVYVTGRYGGTVANSTWTSSPYTISAATQLVMKFNAYVTPSVSLVSGTSTVNPQLNFTYHYMGNSSATFTSGTVYLNSTTGVISGLSKVVTWSGLLHGSGFFNLNVTDGFVWVRSTTHATYAITSTTLTATVPFSWYINGIQTISGIQFYNNSTVSSQGIGVKNTFIRFQMLNPSSYTVLWYESEAKFNMTAGASEDLTYSTQLPTGFSGPYVLRILVLQVDPSTGAEYQLGYLDTVVNVSTISPSSSGVGSYLQPVPNTISFSVDYNRFHPSTNQSKTIEVDMPVTVTGIMNSMEIERVTFNEPWVTLLDPLPKYYSGVSGFSLKIRISPTASTNPDIYMVQPVIEGLVDQSTLFQPVIIVIRVYPGQAVVVQPQINYPALAVGAVTATTSVIGLARALRKPSAPH